MSGRTQVDDFQAVNLAKLGAQVADEGVVTESHQPQALHTNPAAPERALEPI